jgi:TfoX/Sxy family transcriptional regulator of competence genes
MAYDEKLADRILRTLSDQPDLVEKKMFGGVGYLLRGNMACGVNKDSLIVRVGKEAYAEALLQPHAREFDMTGRPMTGWVAVDPQGYASDEDLWAWVQQGVRFALSLPSK